PQSAMGDPARRQRGLRSRHGRRSGNLPEAARSRSSSRVCRRDLQAIDRRDARADPAKARTTRASRLRIPAQRRRQSLHDIRAVGGLAPRRGDRPPRRRRLSDVHFPAAEKIVLVQDNLSTHTAASLYTAFPASEARRLANRFEWHYTPKHGSWLDLGRTRTRSSRHSVPEPPHSRQADPRERSRSLGAPSKQAPRQSRLAVHNRKRPRQTQKAIPSIRMTRATCLQLT